MVGGEKCGAHTRTRRQEKVILKTNLDLHTSSKVYATKLFKD